MTKTEFLTLLENELRKNGITGARDILSEYEEHFAFKLADGYSEAEIAAKLGKPSELAAQFENEPKLKKNGGRKFTTVIGLIFTDLFASIVFALLWVWEIVMGAAAVSFTGLAGCMILGLNFHSIIPTMPYWCGAIFGLSFIALAFLTVIGCIWFAVYLRQLMRVYSRFNHNAMASASGKPVLPPLPTNPQLAPKMRRVLRGFALWTLTTFAVCFVLGMIVSMLSAHALPFWHAWGWFGYTGWN